MSAGLTLSVLIDQATLPALEPRARARKQSLQECASEVIASAMREGMPRFPLTEKAQRVLAFVEQFSAAHGYPPSYDQVAKGVGVRAKSGICRIFDQLEERGAIRRLPNRTRSVEIVERGA